MFTTNGLTRFVDADHFTRYGQARGAGVGKYIPQVFYILDAAPQFRVQLLFRPHCHGTAPTPEGNEDRKGCFHPYMVCVDLLKQ